MKTITKKINFKKILGIAGLCLGLNHMVVAQCTAPTVSFTLHKDPINPQPGIWEISPNYSSGVTIAVWSWGDGSSTTGLYPAHTYTSIGWYNICVQVFNGCHAADSSTTCQTDSLFRTAGTNSMIQVTVLNTNATTGIKTNLQETAQVSLYPNPSSGVFSLQLTNVSAAVSKAQINISNILGEVIYTAQELLNNNSLSKEIDLQNLSNGAYFMQVSIGTNLSTHKIIINK